MGTGWRRARNALGLSVCASFPPELDDLDSRGPRFEIGSRRSSGVQIQENHAESARRQPASSPGANRQPVDNGSRSDTQSPRLRNTETAVSGETVSKNSIPLSPRLNLFRNGNRTPKVSFRKEIIP